MPKFNLQDTEMKRLSLALFLCLVWNCTYSQRNHITGTVLTPDGALPFAYIWVQESGTGYTSDSDGIFKLTSLPEGEITLLISAPGFYPVEVKVHEATRGNKLQVWLEAQIEELEAVLLESEHTGLSRKSPYNLSTINIQGIKGKNHPNGIMGIIRQEPGLNGAEMGPGIVKPIVRGLGFSRIVTLYQGNKLENHQWGADHGLGVNDIGIESVEIIKGPASVLYGSGALGGIIITKDASSYLRSDRPSANISTSFNYLTKGFRTTASLGGKFSNDWFLATDLGYEQHGDYLSGGGRPIGNSRFRLGTVRLHAGLDKERFTNKISFTYNSQQLGIISDQEMEHSLATDPWDYSMQLPFQKVEDYLLSYNQNTKGGVIETFLHLSHHINKRREIETAFEELDLGLDQDHTFLNARIKLETSKLNHQLGVQGSMVNTTNVSDAIDILIPDALLLETGFFYLVNLETGPYFLEGAVRYDYRNLTAFAEEPWFIDANFILPGNPSNRKVSRKFSGFSGSFGATRTFGKRHQVKANFSTGFRAPDLAELFSNGPHPGTSRFEKGNIGFNREQSYQIDLQYRYQSEGFSGSISGFLMELQDYIHFNNTGENTADGLQVWSYYQNQVRFTGLEIDANWNFHSRWNSRIGGSLVRAKEKKSESYISMIPADNLKLELTHKALRDHSLQLWARWNLTASQTRPAPTENETAGYGLVHLGFGKSFRLNKTSNIEAAFVVENLLDKHYLDHLSLLRAFHIPRAGRNVRASLQYSF